MSMRSLLGILTTMVLSVGLTLPACHAQVHETTRPTVDEWGKHQDEAVRLLEEYVRINTANPPGNEIKAAEFFKRLFDRAGIPNAIYAYGKSRANIYAILKGNGTLRPLILLNHLDTVRADSAQWRVPPFSGEILKGELYGRGALDMKGIGLLQAMAVITAAREHLPLQRDLIFLGTADEEVDDTGSEWIIKNHPELVKNAEYLLTEGGSSLSYPKANVYRIGVGEKAPFWIRMTATGPGGHGSVPIGDSAPNRLVRAMFRVVNWEPSIHLLPIVEQFFRVMAAVEEEPKASGFRDIRNALNTPEFATAIVSDRRYGFLLRNTVSLTVIKSGVQTNAIPDTASCELDVRLLPGEDPRAFIAQLRSVISDEGIHLAPIGRFREPNSSSIATGLYHTVEQVVHQHDPGALVTPGLDRGFTESQMYRALGITSYGFNPMVLTAELESTKHAANERVPVAQLRSGLKLLYEIVARTAAPNAM